MNVTLSLLVAIIVSGALIYTSVSSLFQASGKAIGWRIRKKTSQRRSLLIARANTEKKQEQHEKRNVSQTSLEEEWEKVENSRSDSSGDVESESKGGKDWDGIVGFLHPFCNAGGGGERVLWAAIRATQRRWPNAHCVVYTGDHEVTKEQILSGVKEMLFKNRFNIDLHAPAITFLYLSTRHYVLATSWPHFTLLGQSLGSLVMAWDAFNLLVPDIFIDTMGYAFTFAMSYFLFPDVPTAAYVHYPTISTDMLESLDAPIGASHGINAGAGKGWKGVLKRRYWHIFARIYGRVGGNVDVVMTNSSWTQNHIQQLWSPSRARNEQLAAVQVVYPPVAVKELARSIKINAESEATRQPVLLYIAQFRPEKDHQLVLGAFAALLHNPPENLTSSASTSANTMGLAPSLLLIGSVRNTADETYIYSLRLLAHELQITASVTFLINVSWSAIESHLRTASVGINAMWNEHFGIGVVEYQAAGLISVVNDSGGPKSDIVVDLGDGPTGFRATDKKGYAEAFGRALGMASEEKVAMRLRARKSAERFDDEIFEAKWVVQMERLVRMREER